MSSPLSSMPELTTQANQCLQSLSVIQQAVMQQRWENMADVIHRYTHNIQKLEHICAAHGILPQAYLQTFQHLLRQQRRVMRMIHAAQQQTQEHINSTNQGLSKAKKTALMLEGL